MRTIWSFALRNIRMYLRDKTSVFFSLLAVIIIIGLYALFLGEVNMSSIKSMMGSAEGARFLVDSWIMAGIIIVNSVTVTLGVFGIMIDDESKKRSSGFLTAPVGRTALVAGYLIAALIVGFFMCLIALFLAELYIVGFGGKLLPLGTMLKVIGLIAVSVFSSSGLVFFLVSFIRSQGGFGALSTILGTVIGFLTGIYIPVGILPEAVQAIVKFVPASHAAALMRQLFMQAPMNAVFAGAPESVKQSFLETYGVTLKAGESELSAAIMLLYIILSGAVFMALSVWRMSRRRLG